MRKARSWSPWRCQRLPELASTRTSARGCKARLACPGRRLCGWRLAVGLALGSPGHSQAEQTPALMEAADLSDWPSPRADHRLPYGDDPLQFGDLYLPPGSGPHPVVAFIHGGCWLSDYDIAHTARLASAMAESGIAVWSIEYRRGGDSDGGWPGTFLDIERGAGHLSAIAEDHGLDLDRVLAMGHSAGGHLALWLGARSTGVVDKAPFTSDLVIPNGSLLAILAAGRLRYEEWIRWVLPRYFALMGLGCVAIVTAMMIGLQ